MIFKTSLRSNVRSLFIFKIRTSGEIKSRYIKKNASRGKLRCLKNFRSRSVEIKFTSLVGMQPNAHSACSEISRCRRGVLIKLQHECHRFTHHLVTHSSLLRFKCSVIKVRESPQLCSLSCLIWQNGLHFTSRRPEHCWILLVPVIFIDCRFATEYVVVRINLIRVLQKLIVAERARSFAVSYKTRRFIRGSHGTVQSHLNTIQARQPCLKSVLILSSCLPQCASSGISFPVTFVRSAVLCEARSSS